MSRFRRRLMGLAALRQAAADDFVRVEYIENTSNAYIDTLIKPIANRRYVLDCAFTSFDSLQQNGCMQDLGNGTFNRCHFGIRSNLTDFQGCLQRSIYNWQPLDTNRHIWEIGYRNIKFDETIKGTTANDNYLPDVTFCIFARKTNNSVADFCLQRVYSFKIYNGDFLVRDFIPMYQISTDTYGLWDRVKEEFYTSPNGVKFTGGERVIADANDNLYYFRNYIVIQNSAKQCSIGIQPNATDYFETKVYLAGSARNYFCGGCSGNNNNAYGARAMNNTLYFEYGTGAISFAPLGGFANKIFTYKSIFNDTEQKMHFYIFDANNEQLWTNSIAKRGGTSSRAFLLGKLNGSTYGANTNSRMYYFKYWRNQELVRDMIPVQSVETGEYGFFDKVNLKIYYSSGSADFTGA